MNRYFYFLIFISSIQLLHALDFPSLKEYTLLNSKSLKVSKLDIDISKSELEYIQAEKYPSLSLGVSMERSKGLNEDNSDISYIGDNSVSQSTLFKSYSYLSLNYTLFDFSRLNYKLDNQKYDIEVKRNQYCIEVNKLLNDLLDCYYNARISKISDKYLGKILKYSNDSYIDYKRLYDIGEVPKSLVLTNAIKIANLSSDILENKNVLSENIEKLSSLSTLVINENDILKPLSLQNYSKQISFENTHESKRLKNEINKKQAEINLIKAQRYPEVNTFGKYDYYGYDSNSFSNSFDNFSENSYKYGVNIIWTIFDGFKVSSQERKALQELSQLKLKYEQAEIEFKANLNTLDKNYRYYSQIDLKNNEATQLSIKNVNNSQKLNSIGELDKIKEIESMIDKLYVELDNKKTTETISYKLLKKDLLLSGDNECIVR